MPTCQEYLCSSCSAGVVHEALLQLRCASDSTSSVTSNKQRIVNMILDTRSYTEQLQAVMLRLTLLSAHKQVACCFCTLHRW